MSKLFHLLNKNTKGVEYAVRGALAIKAEEMLSSGSRIISCNIGNPQQLNQLPITFNRQVSAILEDTSLLNSGIYKPDVVRRATALLKSIHSLGSYSHSMGVPSIRKSVADFIQDRDGFPSNPDHIFLTAGASPGIMLIMIPIPQYPIYSAAITLYNAKQVPYYLNESKNWSFSTADLLKSLDSHPEIDVKAIVVINPGNPTGNVLPRENIEDIINVCSKRDIVILADEVYQENVYSGEFFSFKKVVREMKSDCKLISFHSVSKGVLGECGKRGGYFECTNIPDDVISVFYKLSSVALCPPVSGQVMVDLMVNPPKKGDESFDLYNSQIDGIFQSLRKRAVKLEKAFNSLHGVSCNPAQGALYLFPRITIPQKAIEKAKQDNIEPDALYCMELLQETGICLVPGSGFLQKEGTYHVRSTILPQEDALDDFIGLIRKFHQEFLVKYS